MERALARPTRSARNHQRRRPVRLDHMALGGHYRSSNATARTECKKSMPIGMYWLESTCDQGHTAGATWVMAKRPVRVSRVPGVGLDTPSTHRLGVRYRTTRGLSIACSGGIQMTEFNRVTNRVESEIKIL